MNKTRSIVALIALLAIGGIASWILAGSSSPILVSNPTLIISENANGIFPVYMKLENTAGANTLLGVQSPQNHQVAIMGGGQSGKLAIPANSKPSLAADGAHFMISGVNPKLSDGTFIPLILSFENGGDVPIKALVSLGEAKMADTETNGETSKGMSHNMQSMGMMQELEPNQPVMKLSLAVEAIGSNGSWQVTVNTENFTFFRVDEMAKHTHGQGHAHLYLNGLKLQRMFKNSAIIGALPPGTHTIKATLNTNDHRAYSVNGKPLDAEVTIEVK